MHQSKSSNRLSLIVRSNIEHQSSEFNHSFKGFQSSIGDPAAAKVQLTEFVHLAEVCQPGVRDF